ncbi:hypothetical protein L665_00631 [Ralstonia solanacearum SD54]|nr:hypothetical protein L665_00631 [Ralstonia solanacearum SD54]
MVVLAQEDRAVIKAARGDGVVAAGHHGTTVVAHRTGVDGQVARGEDHAGVTGGGLRSGIAVAAAALAAWPDIRAVALVNRGRRCGLVDQAIGGIDRDRTGLRLDRTARVGDGGRRDQDIPGRGDGADLIGQLGGVGGQRAARHDAGDLLLGIDDVVRRAVPWPGGSAGKAVADSVGARCRIPDAAGQRCAVDQLLADIVDRTAQADVAGGGDLSAVVQRANLRQIDAAAGGDDALLAGGLLHGDLRCGRRRCRHGVECAGHHLGLHDKPMRCGTAIRATVAHDGIREHRFGAGVQSIIELSHEAIEHGTVDGFGDGLARASRCAIVERPNGHRDIARCADLPPVVGQRRSRHRQIAPRPNDAADTSLGRHLGPRHGWQRDKRRSRMVDHAAEVPEVHVLVMQTAYQFGRQIAVDDPVRIRFQIADRDHSVDRHVVRTTWLTAWERETQLLPADHNLRQVRRIDLLPRHHGRAGTTRRGRIVDDLTGRQIHIAPGADRAPLVQHVARHIDVEVAVGLSQCASVVIAGPGNLDVIERFDHAPVGGGTRDRQVMIGVQRRAGRVADAAARNRQIVAGDDLSAVGHRTGRAQRQIARVLDRASVGDAVGRVDGRGLAAHGPCAGVGHAANVIGQRAIGVDGAQVGPVDRLVPQVDRGVVAGQDLATGVIEAAVPARHRGAQVALPGRGAGRAAGEHHAVAVARQRVGGHGQRLGTEQRAVLVAERVVRRDADRLAADQAGIGHIRTVHAGRRTAQRATVGNRGARDGQGF